MSAMRRAVASPGVGVRLVDAAVPVPDAGEALVRTTLVGICGSDTHAVAGQHPFLTAPYVPGHEATGVVVDVGSAVDQLAAGRRVLLKPNVPCGACTNCLAGRSNACETLTWIGCDPSGVLSGAMAEYFVAPQANLYPVPDALDDRAAALVECLATPVHAARICGDLVGARVVVLGAGTIGVLSVVAALQAGAAGVVVTDMEPAKIDRAVRIGARAGVLATDSEVDVEVRTLLGGPADVVFDCVANERSLAQGVALLRRAGTLLVVGVPARDVTVPLPVIQDHQIPQTGAVRKADVSTATAPAPGEAPLASARFRRAWGTASGWASMLSRSRWNTGRAARSVLVIRKERSAW